MRYASQAHHPTLTTSSATQGCRDEQGLPRVLASHAHSASWAWRLLSLGKTPILLNRCGFQEPCINFCKVCVKMTLITFHIRKLLKIPPVNQPHPGENQPHPG